MARLHAPAEHFLYKRRPCVWLANKTPVYQDLISAPTEFCGFAKAKCRPRSWAGKQNSQHIRDSISVSTEFHIVEFPVCPGIGFGIDGIPHRGIPSISGIYPGYALIIVIVVLVHLRAVKSEAHDDGVFGRIGIIILPQAEKDETAFFIEPDRLEI